MRILYVDDEPSLLDLTKDFLEASGEAEVVTCSSASQALDLIPSQDVKAIVSDYQMPGMDGIEFLKAVRRRWPSMPFILFTGKGREEVAMEALREGADSYIMKGGDTASQYKVLANEVWLAVARREAEDAVHFNLSRFNLIMSNVSDVIFMVSSTQRMGYISPSVTSVLGYERDELEGRDGHDLMWLGGWSSYEQMVRDLRSTLEGDGKALDIRAKDGSIKKMLIKSVTVDRRGERYMVATAKDVTRLRDIEDEMAMKERLLSAVLDRMPEAAGVTDARTGRIIHINSKVTELLGWSYEEMIGKTTVELGVWSASERRDSLAPLSGRGECFEIEKEIQLKAGVTGRFRVEVSRLDVEASSKIGNFMLFRMRRC